MKKVRANNRTKEKTASNVGLSISKVNKPLNQQNRTVTAAAVQSKDIASKIASRGVVSISTVTATRSTPQPIIISATTINNSHHHIIERDMVPGATQTGGPGEKNFIRQLGTGEISILPINASPLLTPSPSPNSTGSSNATVKRRPPSEQIDQIVVNRKRICPLKIAEVVTMVKPNRHHDADNISDVVDPLVSNDNRAGGEGIEDAKMAANGQEDKDDSTGDSTTAANKSKKPKEKTPLSEDFVKLLNICRRVDGSADMEKLINRKLVRYYQTVHPDFVSSKSFTKTIQTVIAEVEAQPDLVYLKLSSLLEELNIRRKSGETVVANDEVATTGNARKDMQIKKLNRALYVLKKKIAQLDEAEVDWDEEDNSEFMIAERLKKRATEIYEKICDITGESKNAQRLVKKPIKFTDTAYPEFNKTLQRFVNETRQFPDMFDVLRCLEHCNLENDYRLSKEECKKIGELTTNQTTDEWMMNKIANLFLLIAAQDSFIKIGKSLQKRRRTDLYETVSYYGGTGADPAVEDQMLQSKLADNQKYHKAINDIIDR